MNILSLFDGMACGRIALKRAGIEVDKYFASEVDKYAIQIAMKNWHDIIQIGDITKWREWRLPDIDLLMGGSPCQGFSSQGKGLNFEHEQSKLFFEFIDVLKNVKPKYFLLENVIMLDQHNDIISSILGELYPDLVIQLDFFKIGRLEPIMIDSALVSAQSRKRLYWTNIPNIIQPKNKGMVLRDILEQNVKSNISQKYLDYALTAIYKADRPVHVGDKAYTILAKSKKLYKVENVYRFLTCKECEKAQTVPCGYTEGVPKTARYNMLGNGWTVDVIVHILQGIADAMAEQWG